MKDYVVITGASSGIGQALTIYLANFGFNIIAIGRNEISLQRIKSHSNQGNITVVVADLTEDSELDKIVKIFNPEDKVKYLIHCAATSEPHLPLTMVSRSSLEKAINLNVMAPLFLTQKLVPYFNIMTTRVLFMGSDYVGVNNKIRPNISGSYGISKSALRVIVEYFRYEYKDIALIGYLNPGATSTPMFETMKTAVLNQHGIFNAGQPSSPDDVAKFIQAVLARTSNQDFVKIDWDYRNKEQHKQAWYDETMTAAPKMRSSL